MSNCDIIEPAKWTTEYRGFRKKQRGKKAIVIGSQIGILVLFLGFWQLASSQEWINPVLFSSPSRMWNAASDLVVNGYSLWQHIWSSLSLVIIGFLISTFAGTLIAILLYQSSMVRRVVDPYISVLNAIPKIALGPLLVIWFGVSNTTILLMCILVGVFITIIAMLASFLQVDEGKLRLMKVMGANRFQITMKLILPASIPAFVTALKVSVAMSWIGVILGEFMVAQSGLGFLMEHGRTMFRFDIVYLSLVILSVLAGVMYFAVAYFEKRIKKENH